MTMPVDVDWSPRFTFGRPRDPARIIGICIHTTENPLGATAVDIASYQLAGSGSYHIVIDSAGTVLRENTDGWRVWASGNHGNDVLLHVSLVAFAAMRREEWLAQDVMLGKLADVLACWSTLHGIPLRKVTGAEWKAGARGVGGHADARDAWGVTTHWDPGAGFPYDVVLARARGLRDQSLKTKGPAMTTPVTKVLEYSRSAIRQDTGYWCGPASAQTILRAATGRLIPEARLAREMGTTVRGTDHISQVARVLNAHAAGRWKVVEMPNDPPSTQQRETLWRHLVASIDAGFGVVLNICSPPSNRPRPSFTSTRALAYRGGTIWHYVAAMGYAVDARGGRHVWWADSGFAPYGSWLTLAQTAGLIPPKGYAFATAGPKPAAKPKPAGAKPAQHRPASPGARTIDIPADNQTQLRGPGLTGWDPQWLARQPASRGGKATLVEMVAACLIETRALRGEIADLARRLNTEK